MDILNAIKRLRDDIKTWVTNNINLLNTKIDNISELTKSITNDEIDAICGATIQIASLDNEVTF